eukprot:g2515.t1
MGRLKRNKKVRKVLEYYRRHFNVKAPYHVLVDGTFIVAALRMKLDVHGVLDQILTGGSAGKHNTTPSTATSLEIFTYDGTRPELEMLEEQFAGTPSEEIFERALGVYDDFPKLYSPLQISKGKTSKKKQKKKKKKDKKKKDEMNNETETNDNEINQLNTGLLHKGIMETIKSYRGRTLLLASQDEQLRELVRETIPGIPILHLNRTIPVIEPVAQLSKEHVQNSEANQKLPSKLERRNLHETLRQQKRRRIESDKKDE